MPLKTTNHDIHSDEEILLHVKTIDAELFEIIYLRRSKKIFLYLMTILNYNKEEVNQILGDVFIALFEYNKKKTIKNCKSFLYKTAHNKAVDWVKKKKEEYGGDEDFIGHKDHKDVQQKDELNLTYKQELMQKYLDMLQDQEKEIIHLYFYEKKSYEEIAEIIGSKKNSVGTALFQAKKKLKEYAEREGIEDILLE